MKYPSLLFTGKRQSGDIADSVFNDLRLDLLLPESALRVMSGICPRTDIPLRAELFCAAEQTKAQLCELYNTINDARLILQAQDKVESDALKDLLFIRLNDKLISFCKKAAALSHPCFFLSRFSAFFADFVGRSEFCELEQKNSLLLEKCRDAQDFCIALRDEDYGPVKQSSPGVLDRLFAAASALEIEPEKPKAFEYRACDEFTLALFKEHGELLSLAAAHRKKQSGRLDTRLTDYADELELILSILALTRRIREAGIPICTPVLSELAEIRLDTAYDVTLLEKGEKNIIPNDAELCGDEKFFFLCGANGGGKTTYLRTLGVNVLLAMTGAPVAARSAVLGCCDGVFTHFPHDEHFEGEGRFDNEKRRVNEILSSIRSAPLVLLNETYSTTNEEKSIVNTSALADELCRRGVLGIYVTHAHEAKADGVNRLIVAVDEGDCNRRTYKVVRAPEAKSSFAADILKKYGLTAEELNARFPEKEGAR